MSLANRRTGMTASRRTTVACMAMCVAALGLAACGTAVGPSGDGGSEDTDPGRLVPDGYTGPLTATVTVLEDPTHGPQMCASVMESYPPQCGGPDVIGWDWSTVDKESSNGTTWGDYTVVGTWEAGDFTVTEPARQPEPYTGPAHDEDDDEFKAPCPAPTGGWVAADPERTTHAEEREAIRIARSSDGFAGIWIDQNLDEELTEANANDPTTFILVIATTGDVASLEARLREVWGGNLCVTTAQRSEADLQEALRDLRVRPGVLGYGYIEHKNHIEADAWFANEALQRELDEKYGDGAVVLTSILRPVDGPSR